MMNSTATILIIDDETVVRNGCVRVLTRHGYAVYSAASGAEGLKLLDEQNFDLVITDIMMPGIDGLEVMRVIRQRWPHIATIVISGYSSVAKAVEAMKQGAADFLPKPFLPEHLLISVKKTLASRNFEQEVFSLRTKAENGLREILTEQSRIKAIIQCMEEGVVVTDRDGVVSLHNAAATRMIRFQQEPLIDKNLFSCMKDPAVQQQIERALAEGLSSAVDLPPGEASNRYLRSRCAPVMSGEDKNLLGTVTVFEDITSLKAMDRMKSEFVAMVSHELKAPLSTIQQMIYFLTDGSVGPINDSQSKILQRVQVRLDELLDLVKNLLELSRIESGAVVYHLEPIFLGPLATGCLAELSIAAQTKQIEMTFFEGETVPPVLGDKRNLDIVIKNLIGNAIKYTLPEGKVSVGLSSDGRNVILKVRDTGIGISEQEIPKIFDKFYRVKDEKMRWITGSGLGLSIIKTIVESHQGKIEVESSYGVGTQFRVILPCLQI